MAITRIIVADCIMAGNLFQEEGFDVERSADNLADTRGQIIVDYLEAQYPGVEVCADIAIQREAGPGRPVEVIVYVGDEEIDQVAGVAIREQLTLRLAEGTADLAWAVRAA
ncbi:hypothetical protein [Desulfobulbus elongatus]|uniref:hypothetical protein n=1 Tax=Desulfobulbus elongatus TaxID=53332 RepID=UPI000B13DE60|nr:hypothetical protein [Desulfobulbus elongatus]